VTDSLSLELDLDHPPEKVWRALTDPALLTEWLLPVAGLRLEPGAAFTLKTQAFPGWDGSIWQSHPGRQTRKCWCRRCSAAAQEPGT
jgi:uncharacterized protein YndB with AHSA1/START domain